MAILMNEPFWVILVISFSMAMAVTDDAAGDVDIAPGGVGDDRP